MKRNEVTREALEALGYKAFCRNRGDGVFSLDPAVSSRADETFNAVLEVVKYGGKIRFERNKLLKEVRVFVPKMISEHRNIETTFFLSRPMTEEELKQYCINKLL